MNDVFIRDIALPCKVHGVTVKDTDDNFNVYINANLCPQARKQAIAHELRHIGRDHFYDEETAETNEVDVVAYEGILE